MSDFTGRGVPNYLLSELVSKLVSDGIVMSKN
jgi:hypothetical protein